LKLRFVTQRSRAQNSGIKSITTFPFPPDLSKLLAEFNSFSDFSWSMVEMLDELVIGLFSGPWLHLWRSESNVISSIPIGLVPRNLACFAHFATDGDTVDGIFAMSAQGESVTIADIARPEVALAKPTDVRCVYALADGAFHVTKRRQFGRVGPDGSDLHAMNALLALNPFRLPYLCDAHVFSCSGNVIFAASHSHLARYDADTLQFRSSVKTVAGLPVAMALFESGGDDPVVFLVVENGSGKPVAVRVGGEGVLGHRRIELQEIVGIAAVSEVTCVVVNASELQICIFDDVSPIPVIRVSESPEDFIYGIHSHLPDAVSIVIARNGIHHIELLGVDELRQQPADRRRRVALCLEHFKENRLDEWQAAMDDLQGTTELFEQFDTEVIGSLDRDANWTQMLEDHVTFIEMLVKYGAEVPAACLGSRLRIIGLRAVSEGELEHESTMALALNYGDFSGVLSAFREDFEAGTFRFGELFVDMLCQFNEFFERQTDRVQFLGPVALTDQLERILAFVLEDCSPCECFPVSSYAEVFRLAVLWCNGLPDGVNLRAACQKVPRAIYEEIAFEAEFFPILAEVVSITKDFARCGTYFEKVGARCIDPIVGYLTARTGPRSSSKSTASAISGTRSPRPSGTTSSPGHSPMSPTRMQTSNRQPTSFTKLLATPISHAMRPQPSWHSPGCAWSPRVPSATLATLSRTNFSFLKSKPAPALRAGFPPIS
jgi:hypothetical protein